MSTSAAMARLSGRSLVRAHGRRRAAAIRAPYRRSCRRTRPTNTPEACKPLQSLRAAAIRLVEPISPRASCTAKCKPVRPARQAKKSGGIPPLPESPRSAARRQSYRPGCRRLSPSATLATRLGGQLDFSWRGASGGLWRAATSSTKLLINLKRYIKPERQWDFNETMTEMVENGDLLIVPQVETECGKAQDVPGTWALAKAKLSPADRVAYEPSRLFCLTGRNLLIPKVRRQADPYVDSDLASACLHEKRVLLTQDTDFADIRLYPPSEYPGIVVFRLPAGERRSRLLNEVEGMLSGLCRPHPPLRQRGGQRL